MEQLGLGRSAPGLGTTMEQLAQLPAPLEQLVAQLVS
jgi:hypothetical protein